MQLKILVPSGVFLSVENVTRIVVMTPGGSFGLLPHRLDCASVLSPGLLTYSLATPGELHVALDAGMLVKTGAEVIVCVRRAICGPVLGQLRQAVEQDMMKLSEQEKSNRARLAQLESGLVRAFVELQRA